MSSTVCSFCRQPLLARGPQRDLTLRSCLHSNEADSGTTHHSYHVPLRRPLHQPPLRGRLLHLTVVEIKFNPQWRRDDEAGQCKRCSSSVSRCCHCPTFRLPITTQHVPPSFVPYFLTYLDFDTFRCADTAWGKARATTLSAFSPHFCFARATLSMGGRTLGEDS